ncbi:polysaccharide deacetylase family protein [Paraglaciecola sp. MB-3u-78]|uniref:polysaccharide deacetylase family protein n=1 Tax=Paraglaciecola sp. MB-3u-78 TaxID=2058332 RepID=UPI000C326734|nr:polysaccharide deacetylase family protein [Paraglaciecola sp. MB-3u-78]PKG97690.1 polysaccharide deacetylase [Paraglaciecola sp. MB-3u-78]
MRKTWGILVLTLTCALLSINTWAKDNAVILLYHHVSNSTPKVTSVSPETFREHMQYLTEHHQVLPLKEVIETLQNKQPLPDKAVVITFDDGYENIYENAHPILKEFSFPYTIFINPPLIGNVSYQLDWQQVKMMANEGASFANHGSQHIHMLTKNDSESEEGWLNRSMQEIDAAETILKDNLGYSWKYFAYPYGEFDSKLKARLRANGYISFAQHSGAIASYSDFSALPRYPSAGVYSNIQSLKVKLNSLAMPVDSVSVSDPKVDLPSYSEDLSFTVKTEDLTAQQINCFQNGQALNKSLEGNTVTVEIHPITKPGRHRVNCTAPSISEKGRFYWFSQPFFMPTVEGKWLD